MGIKNLITIIKKYAPNAIKYTNIKDYKNKTLAIDANLMLYKVVYAIRRNGRDLKNNGIVVTHIHGMMQKLVSFHKYNIKPIFVFDGVPSKLKEDTMKARKKLKIYLQMKYEKAITQDEKKKYFYAKSDITTDEINDAIELIKIFGYPIVEAKDEADIELAYLSRKGLVDAVVTDDMDILVFGGRKVLKSFSVSEKKKIQEISLPKLLKSTGLTQKQLIDIGILLGCDYCPTVSVYGVGPVKSYELIKEYKSIDNLLEKDLIKEDIDFGKAKKYFTKPPINKEDIKKIAKRKKLDRDKLHIFLKEKKFKDKYVKGVFDNLKNK